MIASFTLLNFVVDMMHFVFWPEAPLFLISLFSFLPFRLWRIFSPARPELSLILIVSLVYF